MLCSQRSLRGSTATRGTNIGEQNTKLALVNPVLRALGWDVEDLEDVRSEFRRVPSDKPEDYALMLARTPRLFVEAKALDGNLEDRRWANQIVSYATVAGVEWVVLTNGNEYRIYNAHALAPVEEKLFRIIQISEDQEAAAEALSLLSKEQMQRHSLSGLWQAYSVDRRVKAAVDALFLPDPSPWLVRRLANSLDGLSVGDVRAALARARVTLDVPAQELPRSSRRVVPEEPRKQSDDEPTPSRRPGISDAVAAVSVRQLIEAGVIEPPLELRRQYKGHELTARIEEGGRVWCLGTIYDSVSLAAAMARHSIVGAPPGPKYPQTNGWTFWKFKDHDGQFRELAVLRERLVSSRG